MKSLTKILLNDRKLSLGVTEPGALAYAASLAYSKVGGRLLCAKAAMSSGIYKNAYSCGIPNTDKNGIWLSVALGIVAGKPELELMALRDVKKEDVALAEKMVAEGKIEARISSISSEIYISVTVQTDTGHASVDISETHTNVVKITVNDTVEYLNTENETLQEKEFKITNYHIRDLVNYVNNVDYSEISEIYSDHEINLKLASEGIENKHCDITKQMITLNGGQVLSENELASAQVLTSAAIEARVSGIKYPAMSIAGSGSHGIMCTMPLYAVYHNRKRSNDPLALEKLCRATVLSYLITMYVKEYSGRLSAFCGCGIAGGIGVSCAIIYFIGGNLNQMSKAICNLASGITGMICDGGNKGCVIKAITAVDAVWRAITLSMSDIVISGEHGICDYGPEDVIRNVGKIADPGMLETEKTIISIFENKAKRVQKQIDNRM